MFTKNHTHDKDLLLLLCSFLVYSDREEFKKKSGSVVSNGSPSKDKGTGGNSFNVVPNGSWFNGEKQNPKNVWQKTIINELCEESGKNDCRKNPNYESPSYRPTNDKEAADPRKNTERNSWGQSNRVTNGLEKKLDRSNNNYSSPRVFSAQNFNNKNDRVFDKRDFLFSNIPKCLREQIQLDDVAQYSVTDTRTADKISDFIAKLDGINKNNNIITDGTACCGGNTMSFCKKFKKVQAIELDQKRHDMLVHNLKTLSLTNVECYHANYLDLLDSLTQDIVFLDPPSGGPSYEEKNEVDLFLGDVSLNEICEKLKLKTKYVIIKAPQNFNYNEFQAKVSGKTQIYYEFRKMLLVVVDYFHPETHKNEEARPKASQKNKSFKTVVTETEATKAAEVGAARAAEAAVVYYSDYEGNNATHGSSDNKNVFVDSRTYAKNQAYKAAFAIYIISSTHNNDPDKSARLAANGAYGDAWSDLQTATDDADGYDIVMDRLNYTGTCDYYNDFLVPIDATPDARLDVADTALSRLDITNTGAAADAHPSLDATSSSDDDDVLLNATVVVKFPPGDEDDF